MMGSGKSTVGRELAARTGWPFLDNDALVRSLTGRAPEAIDAEDGEDALHVAETTAFRSAIERPGPAIVAVAGAVVDDDVERDRIGAAGHVVWLRASAATLRRRIGDGAGRRADALDEDWLAAKANERESRYRAAAAQVIDVDELTTEAIASAILDAIGWRSAG